MKMLDIVSDHRFKLDTLDEKDSELYSLTILDAFESNKGANMVQELQFDSTTTCTREVNSYESCTMFPSPRQSPYNVNLNPFGGYQASPQQAQYGQDFTTQFSMGVGDPTAALQQTAVTSSSWAAAGMYPDASGRAAMAGLSQDWSQYLSQGTTGTSHHGQSTAASYPYHRAGALPTIPMDYPSQGTTLPQGNLSMMNSSLTASINSSPSPNSMMGSPGVTSGASSANRQARAPYDWMKKQSYQTAPSTGKTRTKDKYRVVYSDHQRLELEKEFHYSRYITIRRKAELAQNLNLSERQVKIWFQNRRAKERKHNKKKDDITSVGVKNEIPIQTQQHVPVSQQHTPVTMPTPQQQQQSHLHPQQQQSQVTQMATHTH